MNVQGDPRLLMRRVLNDYINDDVISKKIELSCYNSSIAIARNSPSLIQRNWQNDAFVNIYNSRCGIILTHLLKNNQSDRTCESNLLSRIMSGDIDLATIGTLNERDLCPDTLKAEKAEIQQRLNQKVVVKYSTMFKCPKCKRKDKIIATEKQVRALDEGRSTFCECQACGEKFRAS